MKELLIQDNSDHSCLILADWHEEFGDIKIAEHIRENVINPKTNNWFWELQGVSEVGGFGVGEVGVVGFVGVGGVGSGSGVGGGDGGKVGVGGVGNAVGR